MFGYYVNRHIGYNMLSCNHRGQGNADKVGASRNRNATQERDRIATPQCNAKSPPPLAQIKDRRQARWRAWKGRSGEYREYRRLAEEAQAAADGIADAIKAAMNDAGQIEMAVGEYKVRYAECRRTDFDKKALQADHADIYAAYARETTYRRFTVA